MKFQKLHGLSLPVWKSFTTEGFLEALKRYHQAGLALADEVAALPRPTYNDVICRFEHLDCQRLMHIRILGHLKNVDMDAYPGIAKLDREGAKRERAYNADLDFHKGLYNAYLFVHAHEYDTLTLEQRYIIDEGIKGFEQNGVGLARKEQKCLRAALKEIAQLESTFETHVVKSVDAWSLQVTDEKRLAGIPLDVVKSAEKRAKKKKRPGYLFSQKSDVVLAVLEYADDRSLREELWHAFSLRASSSCPTPAKYDNSPIMVQLLALRDGAARLLGRTSHAMNSIQPKMSGAVGVEGVSNFIESLARVTHEKAMHDRKMLEDFAAQELGITDFQPWDFGYVSRIYKDKFLAVEDEKVRDYLPAGKVFEGLMGLMQRLFGCTLREAAVDTWHPDVRFYEVCDKNGKVFAGFYVDLLARQGKRSGAWMDDLGWRLNHDGIKSLPVAFLCCNFRTPSDGGEPYLLHDDVVTVYHETGHVFHHLLTRANYAQSAMMHVEWDTVELPSQLLEHWAWDRDMLRAMSAHKETGEAIPDGLIDAMLRAKHYLAGTYHGWLFGLALFDWNIHKGAPLDYSGIMSAFHDALITSNAVPVHDYGRGPNNFTHAFGGGYDAGYFCYSWALSLVADVAAAFAEAGKDGEAAVAARYCEEILARGASRPMIESFRAFRGRNPDPLYLIPYLGLN